MRIESPHRIERIGGVRLHAVREVLEFDSGIAGAAAPSTGAASGAVRHVPMASISEMKERMAIVVPVKGERLKVLDGVLSAIPHDCLIIVVSNSPRDPVDRYQAEVETLESFCRRAHRPALIIHQRGPGPASAFAAAGMPEMLDERGLVRHGKGEGMLLGMALAKLAGKEFVGFVDADNYIPGSVYEYVQSYAAMFCLAESPYALVRISWHSKPTFTDGQIFFQRRGRASRLTNEFLNLLIADYTGFGTEVIVTGNAGEHALSMDLALRLRFAGGFAVEPYELVNVLERYGGVEASPDPALSAGGVNVYQVETRNPHLHEKGEEDHIRSMQLQALSAIYHSPICSPRVRAQIEAELDSPADLPEVPIYPALGTLDWAAFAEVLGTTASTLHQIERVVPSLLVLEKPIPDLGAAMFSTGELERLVIEEQAGR